LPLQKLRPTILERKVSQKRKKNPLFVTFPK